MIRRLLKNGHLLLSGPLTFSRACEELRLTRRNGTPHPSPCQARGRLVAAYVVGNGLKPFPAQDFGSLASGHF